jgi:hypothetical protein
MPAKFWSENHKGRARMVDLGVCGGNIKMVLKEIMYYMWIRFNWLRYGPVRVLVNTIMQLRVT